MTFSILLLVAFIFITPIPRLLHHALSPKAKAEYLRSKREEKISASFVEFEKTCRLKHERDANDKFQTLNLSEQLNGLLVVIQKEADVMFGSELSRLRSGIMRARSEIVELKVSFELFCRNYRQALDELYEEKKSLSRSKDELHSELKALRLELSNDFKRKDDAFEYLNKCKGNIDSWYAKSERTPWLLGNARSKIPKRSIFGQSFGDLDGYKFKRDAAYGDVQRIKGEILEVKNRIDLVSKKLATVNIEFEKLNTKINDVKAARDRMYKLKSEGLSKEILRNRLECLQSYIAAESSKLSACEGAENEFRASKRNQYGAEDLAAKIKFISKQKDEFIKEFDFKLNQLARSQEHRKQWLESNPV